MDTGTSASLNGRAKYFMLGIVIRGLRIFTDIHRGKLFRAPYILRNGGTGNTEVIESHVTFAQMMPFRRTGPR